MKEIRRQNTSDERPKSHSPSSTSTTTAATDPRKKFDSNDRKVSSDTKTMLSDAKVTTSNDAKVTSVDRKKFVESLEFGRQCPAFPGKRHVWTGKLRAEYGPSSASFSFIFYL